jgi:hypothetical protein
METTQCMECGSPIKGRRDKKFCDDNCRNTFNNRHYTEESAAMRSIHNILKRNRRILETTIDKQLGKCRVHKELLYEKGFNFGYHTHLQTTQAGSTYYFCFEYGYLPLEQEFLMLVKREQKR